MTRLSRRFSLPAIFALLAVALVLAGGARAAEQGEILVTSNGWHSGIVLARADAAAIPETMDFPDASYFEFGWGDAVYYPTPQPNLGLALGAMFPGPAVLHLAGLPDHPARVFPSARVVRVTLSKAALAQLIAHLAAAFERSGEPRVRPSAEGLYPFSRFYPATGRFHAFNTCNTWTARALQSAGLAIEPEGVQTASELMARLDAALAR
jgi:uncharacterized protein (TIGR02117 family)